ncbi:motility associated factor glycosyltransferase family protein [Tepidibacter aestuarii]|uniref:motility associated factor glycosyltransferase family protein n=1 Tax=Tepidibacter aestuarii TaxID=2925782 RepID=UPI0020BFABA5|nr:6-hydroxymethylpterin diphosphokinase MptE-like protein [Tepidibacter aestuarii]CAH2211884.1 conserved protein of unknown function mptE-like [Tepidibacter aestuarii]
MKENNTYIDNISALRRRFPYIIDLLESCNLENKEVSSNILKSKDGNLTMSLKRNKEEIYLYSKYNPLSRVKNKLEYDLKEVKKGKKNVLLLIGLGLGYEIEYMLNEEYIDNIIVFEPDIATFCDVINKKDITNIINSNKVVLILGENDEYLESLMSYVCSNVVYSYSQIYIKTNKQYNKIYPKKISIFLKKFKDILEKNKTNLDTEIRFSLDWSKNIIKNIPYLFESYSVNIFEDFLKNTPAFIISAGPSLNKNIQLLKAIDNRGIIICTDTALKPMLKNNIKPHLVISVDGSCKNYKKYENTEYADIPLFYSVKVNDKILSECKSKKVIYSAYDEELSKILKKLNIGLSNLPSGGSVANNALSLAIFMNANPIVLVGQDLAYSNNQKHATGTLYDDSKNYIDQEEKLVEGIDGKLLKTNESLLTFLKWFEDVIKRDKNNRVYVNATEGGANIKGTTVMKLEDVINRYCNEPKDLNLRFNNLLENSTYFINEEYRKEVIGIFEDELFNLIKYKNILEENIKICEILINEIDSKLIREYLEILDLNDRKISNVKNETIFIGSVLTNATNNIILNIRRNNNLNESENENNKSIALDNSLYLYQELIKSIEYIIPIIKTTINKLIR